MAIIGGVVRPSIVLVGTKVVGVVEPSRCGTDPVATVLVGTDVVDVSL